MRLRPVVAFLALLAAGCPKEEKVEVAKPPVADEPAKGAVDAESVPWETRLKAANGWNGTYKNLLAVLHVPEDVKSYSPHSEYGWKDALPYKTFGVQPAGWWVYVAPYWFVWDTRDGDRKKQGPGTAVSSDGAFPPADPAARPGLVDASTLPMPVLLRAAAGANAKYTNVLAAILDPEDKKTVTAFSEYGWRESTSYKTYGTVPAGYWVYVEPYWVIWNLKDGNTGP